MRKLIGKTVRIKNGEHEHGTVMDVIGEGPAATYMIRTVDGIEWLYRDQFTMARSA